MGRAGASTLGHAAAVEFRVLGPLEVAHDGAPVGIRGSRQRITLAMLLLHAGRVVSVDMLAAAIWADRPPATARTQIAMAVSALRRAFADAGVTDQVIATVPPGYLLRVGDEQVDVDVVDQQMARAEAAAAHGRPEETVAILRAALRIWRGHPFADVRSAPVAAAAARLDERRLTLVEECLRWELALGREREVVGEIRAYVDQHPFRERLRGQLMVSLYRTGRCAEALAVYRDFWRVLADEAGLDPGWELRELHRNMLLGMPLPPAEPFAATVAPQPAALDRLADQRSRRPRVIANLPRIGGAAKIGLATRWAHRVAARFPDGVIFVNLGRHDGNRRMLEPEAAVERIRRALTVPAQSPPKDPEAPSRTTVRGRPVLFILDNARYVGQVRPAQPGSDGRSAARPVALGIAHLARGA